MPELPEVETSRCGIEPHIINNKINGVVIRQKKIRWPIPVSLKKNLPAHTTTSIKRPGKYPLPKTSKGTLIIHLGMSGSLHIVSNKISAEKPDHFEIAFSNGKLLRLRDPRRFGAVLWTRQDIEKHKLIENLGPEPLTDEFTADYIHQASRKRKVAIKTFIMNSHIVVGVGNIYANEALFMASIHPGRMSSRVSLASYKRLVETIKDILQQAIEQGGTTLRDFSREDGKPGYFQQKLNIYGKAGQPCTNCKQPIKQIRQQQRSTYYCSHCQN